MHLIFSGINPMKMVIAVSSVEIFVSFPVPNTILLASIGSSIWTPLSSAGCLFIGMCFLHNLVFLLYIRNQGLSRQPLNDCYFCHSSNFLLPASVIHNFLDAFAWTDVSVLTTCLSCKVLAEGSQGANFVKPISQVLSIFSSMRRGTRDWCCKH